MAKKKGVNCRNRLVVHAENRLHSPFYDWDGQAGLAQSSFEFIEADAMCFWGICDSKSYNAWVSATQAYFDDVLVPQRTHLRSLFRMCRFTKSETLRRTLYIAQISGHLSG